MQLCSIEKMINLRLKLFISMFGRIPRGTKKAAHAMFAFQSESVLAPRGMMGWHSYPGRCHRAELNWAFSPQEVCKVSSNIIGMKLFKGLFTIYPITCLQFASYFLYNIAMQLKVLFTVQFYGLLSAVVNHFTKFR
jgi:hypothetical protein